MIKMETQNIISENTQLEGNIHFNAITTIFGTLNGTIESRKHQLTLEAGSYVKGMINCSSIDIYGTVEANIESDDTVIIRSNAIVTGAIKSKNLVIYPGAQVNIEAHSDHKNLL
ncbi:MAG: polymer-forming cytoskeletal protein [Bacteriovoracaceae bacterium]|jgi:cytoskeletal protein CcmA (bactofilin family)|nr:polymer-forming cytoskeletal protein [Bacteriovoracaceae bacterium]